MTPTPNPIAEQVFEVAMQLAAMTLGQTVSGRLRKSDLAHYLLRNVPLARGLLSVGASSEEQIERATQNLWQHFNPGFAPIDSDHPDHDFYREAALAAAAGVTPQGPSSRMFSPSECPNADHPEMESCGLCDYRPAPPNDREKLIAEYVNPRMPGRQNSDGHLMAQAFRAGWDAALAAPLDPEKDERVLAWEQVAKHPVLKQCYAEERPLLPAVLDQLTDLFELEQAVNELAPAPERIPFDPEKVAGVVGEHLIVHKSRCECGVDMMPDYKSGMTPADVIKRHVARALCDAYMEGKLT